MRFSCIQQGNFLTGFGGIPKLPGRRNQLRTFACVACSVLAQILLSGKDSKSAPLCLSRADNERASIQAAPGKQNCARC